MTGSPDLDRARTITDTGFAFEVAAAEASASAARAHLGSALIAMRAEHPGIRTWRASSPSEDAGQLALDDVITRDQETITDGHPDFDGILLDWIDSEAPFAAHTVAGIGPGDVARITLDENDIVTVEAAAGVIRWHLDTPGTPIDEGNPA